jgi:hypothetical protein
MKVWVCWFLGFLQSNTCELLLIYPNVEASQCPAGFCLLSSFVQQRAFFCFQSPVEVGAPIPEAEALAGVQQRLLP